MMAVKNREGMLDNAFRGPQALAVFDPDIGLLVLRLAVGALIFSHGCQKLFGWFDGPGWRGNGVVFEQLGFTPGTLFGTFAGLTEIIGGALLLLGLLTPLAAAAVIGQMLSATFATWNLGMYHGYELTLTFAVIGAVVAFTGPGRYSLDRRRSWRQPPIGWAVGCILIGVAAAGMVLVLKHML